MLSFMCIELLDTHTHIARHTARHTEEHEYSIVAVDKPQL